MGILLQLENLKKYFSIESGFLRKVKVDLKAVDDVSFTIEEGETFGLVGESGCGKTTIGKLVLKLYEATSGKILFRGRDVTHFQGTPSDEYRKDIQAVFQNPYASLNPRMRIWRLIGEPLIVRGWPKKKVREKVLELLELVMLPADCGPRFPHEMSAGTKAAELPLLELFRLIQKFIVLDEPTSLLDVSAQGFHPQHDCWAAEEA